MARPSPCRRSEGFLRATRSRSKKVSRCSGARASQCPCAASVSLDGQLDLDHERLILINEPKVGAQQPDRRLDQNGAGTAERHADVDCGPPSRMDNGRPPWWALRLSEMTAPMVLDGPMTGTCFYLRPAGPRAHHANGRRRDLGQPAHSQDHRRARSRRNLRRLAYVPAALLAQLNPIENAFSQLRRFCGKLPARTVDELWAALASASATFTPTVCTKISQPSAMMDGDRLLL